MITFGSILFLSPGHILRTLSNSSTFQFYLLCYPLPRTIRIIFYLLQSTVIQDPDHFSHMFLPWMWLGTSELFIPHPFFGFISSSSELLRPWCYIMVSSGGREGGGSKKKKKSICCKSQVTIIQRQINLPVSWQGLLIE